MARHAKFPAHRPSRKAMKAKSMVDGPPVRRGQHTILARETGPRGGHVPGFQVRLDSPPHPIYAGAVSIETQLDMTRDEQNYMSEFERFLAGKGLRLTMQRRQLTEVVMTTHEHLTVDELVERVRAQNLPIGRATVYRTVDLL